MSDIRNINTRYKNDLVAHKTRLSPHTTLDYKPGFVIDFGHDLGLTSDRGAILIPIPLPVKHLPPASSESKLVLVAELESKMGPEMKLRTGLRLKRV
ncbi:hypothetical protein EVAR_87284_1 [Eumeta japonica]|uniref:Uncharacterized protein n=1 Tax=Eumeta variegata TaxID=151549 RepID=A0A4C1VYK9_EUMVA|nr:hypothetical protein EVAR_87284_1 [Eumeta japonica]